MSCFLITITVVSLIQSCNQRLPISDNGGSSREIVRVLGGPAIGDIRSRLIRLASERTEEQKAIKNLLDHRLPFDDRRKAKEEMLSIVDGSHSLWYPNGKLEPFRAGDRCLLYRSIEV